MQGKLQSARPASSHGRGGVVLLRRVWRVVMLAFGLTALVAQADDRAVEYKVKSAFLVKFGMFVEWPGHVFSTAPDQFTIGILGEDPFGTGFDEAVKKEKVAGRTIRILRSREAGELKSCQIVFIAASESARLSEWLTELSGRGILTVADEFGFAGRGGMIGFIKEDGKVRFEINLAAAEQAGLKISSKLLQVGRRVGGPGPAAG